MSDWKKAENVFTTAQLKRLGTLKRAAQEGRLETEEKGEMRVLKVRGRPKLEKTKQQITLRLSPEVIEHFKGLGAGWQTRIDQALRQFVDQQ